MLPPLSWKKSISQSSDCPLKHLELGPSRTAFGKEPDIPLNSNLSPRAKDSGALLSSMHLGEKCRHPAGGKEGKGGRDRHGRARRESSCKQSGLPAAGHYLHFLKDVLSSFISSSLCDNRKSSRWQRKGRTKGGLNRLRNPARVPESGRGGRGHSKVAGRSDGGGRKKWSPGYERATSLRWADRVRGRPEISRGGLGVGSG